MRKNKAIFWTLAATALVLAFGLGMAVGFNANSRIDDDLERLGILGAKPAKAPARGARI